MARSIVQRRVYISMAAAAYHINYTGNQTIAYAQPT